MILSGIVIVLSIFLYVQLEHQTQINLCNCSKYYWALQNYRVEDDTEYEITLIKNSSRVFIIGN